MDLIQLSALDLAIAAGLVLLLSALAPANKAASTKIRYALDPGSADNIQLEDLAALREHVVEHPPDELERDVLERQRRPVEELEPDTTYWNWGPCNFRFFAMDEDGAETMNDFYRYTLAPGDPPKAGQSEHICSQASQRVALGPLPG